jgi:hypothetical protein
MNKIIICSPSASSNACCLSLNCKLKQDSIAGPCLAYEQPNQRSYIIGTLTELNRTVAYCKQGTFSTELRIQFILSSRKKASYKNHQFYLKKIPPGERNNKYSRLLWIFFASFHIEGRKFPAKLQHRARHFFSQTIMISNPTRLPLSGHYARILSTIVHVDSAHSILKTIRRHRFPLEFVNSLKIANRTTPQKTDRASERSSLLNSITSPIPSFGIDAPDAMFCSCRCLLCRAWCCLIISSAIRRFRRISTPSAVRVLWGSSNNCATVDCALPPNVAKYGDTPVVEFSTALKA